jgi:hypothetical protein
VNGSEAISRGQDLENLTEEIVFLIRQSCAIHLARVDAFLEGAELAAEQVQDIRIQKLETPQEVTGWEIFGEVVLTFILESNLAGRFLAAAAKRVFTRPLRHWYVFTNLPEFFLSPTGVGLKREAQRLARMNEPRAARMAVPRTRRQPTSVTLQAVIGPQLRKEVGSKDVRYYSDSLEAIIRGTQDVQDALTGGVQAVNELRNQPDRSPPLTLDIRDTAGVTILSAVQNYANLVRLGIRISHARFEKLVRTQQIVPSELPLIIDLFTYEDLQVDLGTGGKIACDLGEIRARNRRVIEALIWAKLFNFNREKVNPRKVGAGYQGVDKALSEYWFLRFASLVDEWNQTRGSQYGYKGLFKDAIGDLKAEYLQRYFWHLTTNLATVIRLPERQLTQRAAP